MSHQPPAHVSPEKSRMLRVAYNGGVFALGHRNRELMAILRASGAGDI
jgi:hypothetical protein